MQVQIRDAALAINSSFQVLGTPATPGKEKPRKSGGVLPRTFVATQNLSTIFSIRADFLPPRQFLVYLSVFKKCCPCHKFLLPAPGTQATTGKKSHENQAAFCRWTFVATENLLAISSLRADFVPPDKLPVI
ncbi:MAG: hypothetical protein ACLPYB_09440 [Desulfobaccales bacterium]